MMLKYLSTPAGVYKLICLYVRVVTSWVLLKL